MKHQQYKQLISIMLSISLVGTSISLNAGGLSCLAVPGATEVPMSDENIGLERLSNIETKKVPWFYDFKIPDKELNRIISEISLAYEKTGENTPDFNRGDNLLGEGPYWPSPKGFIATFLKYIGVNA